MPPRLLVELGRCGGICLHHFRNSLPVEDALKPFASPVTLCPSSPSSGPLESSAQLLVSDGRPAVRDW